jgi:hypothetical protein
MRGGVRPGGTSMNPEVVVASFASAWFVPNGSGGREYLANMGGPCSRTRTEEICSTVLGDNPGPIRCPRVLRVGIDFERESPVVCAQRWLDAAGFADEEEARSVLPLPPGPCICQIDTAPRPVVAATLTALEGLRLALVLGLCTPYLYQPQRPVLWTEASLTRRLLLYDGEGFYA